jgi:Trk-type K+ transport system membrane component
MLLLTKKIKRKLFYEPTRYINFCFEFENVIDHSFLCVTVGETATLSGLISINLTNLNIITNSYNLGFNDFVNVLTKVISHEQIHRDIILNIGIEESKMFDNIAERTISSDVF